MLVAKHLCSQPCCASKKKNINKLILLSFLGYI